MNCTHTPALTDAQLLAAIDGEGDPYFRAHLAHCAPCRHRLHLLRQEEAQVRHVLSYGAACPSRTELEQYYLGELSISQEAAVAAHLRSHCPACQAMVAVIMQAFVDLAPPLPVRPLASESKRTAENFGVFWAKLQGSADPGATPPPAVTPRPMPVTNLLQRVKDGLTIFIAELVAAPNLAPALRGDAGKLPLIYRAGEIEIRIDLQPELGTDRKVLIGQVKAPASTLAELQVLLLQGEKTIANALVESKRGRFQLPSLPPGDYALVVRSAQWEIQIPNLDCR